MSAGSAEEMGSCQSGTPVQCQGGGDIAPQDTSAVLEPKVKRPKRRFGRTPAGRDPIDWEAQPLGQMSDGDLAAILGVNRTTVLVQRTGRGIPKYGGPRREIVSRIPARRLHRANTAEGVNNRSVTCECGSEKVLLEAACRRCMFLDGSEDGANAAAIISELRAFGPMTEGELSGHLGIDKAAFTKCLGRLMAVGRVRRVICEREVSGISYGTAVQKVVELWEYQLVNTFKW